MTLPGHAPEHEPPRATPLPDPAQADLMPSLGRLVRGLSTLFWALPLTLVLSVQTARTSFLAEYGVVPPVLASALIVWALTQMGRFRRQERVWLAALERARLLAVINLGLSPFLYWWKLRPDVLQFQVALVVLAAAGLAFMFALNQALQRLAAMLPDETLRLEARLFTNLNLGLLAGALVVTAGCVLLAQWRPAPVWLLPLQLLMNRAGLSVLLVFCLLPLALTLTLIWKIKEAILGSVFGAPPRR